MGKFGKKVEVSKGLENYMIGILGPSGFGKTTLMYHVCEKEFGPDGYIILDMGQENGVSALEGVVAERTPTWKKVKEVVDDIVTNKNDYPELKVVVFDTLDAAFESAEIYTVDAWNREHIMEPNFKKASSINSVEGGFGKGMDRVIDTVKREIARLASVGVGVWFSAHCKEKDQTDLYTGAAYTTLTANMTTKYFNSIKNSSHVIGCGYFDRSIEKTEIGEENPITKKKKERKSIVDETRKIKFRDSMLVADAKSRFSDIVDEINLNADEFIKAIKAAIKAERDKNVGTTTVKSAATSETIAATNVVDETTTKREVPLIPESMYDTEGEEVPDELVEDDPFVTDEELIAYIKNNFSALTYDTKVSIKESMKGVAVVDLPTSDLLKIKSIMEKELKVSA